VKEYKLFDTPGNIFKIEESDIQINNKPDTAITEQGSKNAPVLTSGGKNENITGIACHSAAGQCLSLLLIFKNVNKKR